MLALLTGGMWAQEAQKPEELYSRADALISGGDTGAAVALYRDWLLAGGESEAFAEVLSRAVDTASELKDALRLLADFAPRVRDPAAREALLEREAGLLRLSGRVEEALAVQLGLPENPARLVERASLYRELGLSGEAEQILLRARESADAEASAAARMLLAELYLSTGREAQGVAELRELLRNQPKARSAPAALLALGEALRASGDARGAEEVLAELKARFPSSPEALLAGSAGVRQAALPQRLLPFPPQEGSPQLPLPEPPPATGPDGPAGPAASAPSAVSEGAGPAAPAPRLVLVQAGSFRDPENARDMARDLGARGFDARVVEKSIGEARYFRVVVGPQQSPEAAQSLILRLKDAGYEGFLLLE